MTARPTEWPFGGSVPTDIKGGEQSFAATATPIVRLGKADVGQPCAMPAFHLIELGRDGRSANSPSTSRGEAQGMFCSRRRRYRPKLQRKGGSRFRDGPQGDARKCCPNCCSKRLPPLQALALSRHAQQAQTRSCTCCRNSKLLKFFGDPDRNRTCDLQIRNLPLYPTELRDQPTRHITVSTGFANRPARQNFAIMETRGAAEAGALPSATVPARL